MTYWEIVGSKGSLGTPVRHAHFDALYAIGQLRPFWIPFGGVRGGGGGPPGGEGGGGGPPGGPGAPPGGREGGKGNPGVPGLTPIGSPGLVVIPPGSPHLSVCVSHRLLQQNVRVVHCQVGSHVLSTQQGVKQRK